MPDPATYWTRCAYCNNAILVAGKGKASARYCRPSHKQLAYRRRQTARGISRDTYEHPKKKEVVA